MQVAASIVFDLDGTLVDTAGDLVAVLNRILGEEGCEPLLLQDVRPMIGHGARALLERGLSARFHPVSPERLDGLTARFLDLYAAGIAVQSRPFPGLVAALDALEGEGCRFAVLTNKLERLARQLLDALDLSDRFATLVGGDTFPFAKPDPRVLLATIARLEGEPSRAVLVGDSATDLATARAADIPAVLVSFGYSEVPVRDLQPDALIERFEDLPDAVARLIARVP